MWRKREIGEMMTKNEALQKALDALGPTPPDCCGCQTEWQIAITAIKAALEAKDEPVAYINVEQRKLEWAKYMSWDTPTVVNLPKIPLYTTPPQRTWVGLTDEDEIDWEDGGNFKDLVKAIEAKLKEKNT
jgi:hypothetical protein